MDSRKVDALFAAKALQKRVDATVKDLKMECDAEMLDSYRQTGSTQVRSQSFGKSAGTYTVPISEAKPERVEDSVEVEDEDALICWMRENPNALRSFALANQVKFAEYHLAKTGEIPDGVGVATHTIEAVPETPGTPTLRVRDDVVFQALGDRPLDAINVLLLDGRLPQLGAGE